MVLFLMEPGKHSKGVDEEATTSKSLLGGKK